MSLQIKIKFVLFLSVFIGLKSISCTGASTSELLNGDTLNIAISANPVTLLSPTIGTVVAEQPKFSWTLRDGVEFYRLQIAVTDDFEDIVLNLKTNETIYTLDNDDLIDIDTLAPVEYYWRVIADYGKETATSSSSNFFKLDDAIYVHSESSVTFAIGNQSHPLRSITEGITHAFNSGKSDVRVAAGDYYEVLNLLEGVSLYGGYETDDWTRDPEANETVVYGYTDDFVVRATAQITTATVVDGFTLRFQAGGEEGAVVEIIAGSPTINNNRLLMSEVETAYMVRAVGGAAPVITNNKIASVAVGNAFTEEWFGVYGEDLNGITVSGNEIDAVLTSTGTQHIGVRMIDSQELDISDNVITGIANVPSYGILVNDCNGEIDGNTINGDTGTWRGVSITDCLLNVTGNNISNLDSSTSGSSGENGFRQDGGTVNYSDNTISGGGVDTTGFYITGTAVATIESNSVSLAGALPLTGILTESSSNVNIIANTITLAGSDSICIGISYDDTMGFIVRNSMEIDNGGPDVGISLTNGTDGTLIANNILSMKSDNTAFTGIVTDTTDALIYNNTLYLKRTASANSIGINFDTSNSDVRNNLIVTDVNMGNVYRIFGAGPANTINNNFTWEIGLGSLEADYYDNSTFRYICNADGNFWTGSCTGSAASAPVGVGNYSTDITGQFVDFSGNDGDPATLADNDWRLSDSADCNLRFGGDDLSGDFTNDAADTTRTASTAGLPCSLTVPSDTAGDGWSIGAYEWTD